MTLPRTAAEVLSRHVLFEIESIDRLYLNLYVPELQRVGQVVGFLTRHLGFEIPSTRSGRAAEQGVRRSDQTVCRRAPAAAGRFRQGATQGRCAAAVPGPLRRVGAGAVHRSGPGEDDHLPDRVSAQPDHRSGLSVDRPGHGDGQPVLRLRRRRRLRPVLHQVRRACAFPRTRPKQAPRGARVVRCCSTVLPAVRVELLVRTQAACTRCVRRSRGALGVLSWAR